MTYIDPNASPGRAKARRAESERRQHRRRRNREFVKTGMAVSMTALALTGFKIVKPMNPLHKWSAIALLAFTGWHVYQNERSGRR